MSITGAEAEWKSGDIFSALNLSEESNHGDNLDSFILLLSSTVTLESSGTEEKANRVAASFVVVTRRIRHAAG